MKPEAGPILAFAKAFGATPVQVVVVGDTVLDLDAARAAGSLAVGVLTGPASADTLSLHADALLASYADLATWLEGR